MVLKVWTSLLAPLSVSADAGVGVQQNGYTFGGISSHADFTFKPKADREERYGKSQSSLTTASVSEKYASEAPAEGAGFDLEMSGAEAKDTMDAILQVVDSTEAKGARESLTLAVKNLQDVVVGRVSDDTEAGGMFDEIKASIGEIVMAEQPEAVEIAEGTDFPSHVASLMVRVMELMLQSLFDADFVDALAYEVRGLVTEIVTDPAFADAQAGVETAEREGLHQFKMALATKAQDSSLTTGVRARLQKLHDGLSGLDTARDAAEEASVTDASLHDEEPSERPVYVRCEKVPAEATHLQAIAILLRPQVLRLATNLVEAGNLISVQIVHAVQIMDFRDSDEVISAIVNTVGIIAKDVQSNVVMQAELTRLTGDDEAYKALCHSAAEFEPAQWRERLKTAYAEVEELRQKLRPVFEALEDGPVNPENLSTDSSDTSQTKGESLMDY